MKKQLSFTKDKKGDDDTEQRTDGRATKGNKLTQLYLGAVDRSRSSSRNASPKVKPKPSFNRSGFKVDKDEIKKAYHDVRSDNTGTIYCIDIYYSLNPHVVISIIFVGLKKKNTCCDNLSFWCLRYRMGGNEIF